MRKQGMLVVIKKWMRLQKRVGPNAQKRSTLFVRLRFARLLLRQFPLIYKQLLLLLYCLRVQGSCDIRTNRG